MVLTSFLVVIVLYKANLEQSDSFISLTQALRKSSQKAEIFVYDNSPSASIMPSPEDYPEWKLHYFHNPRNPGVSTAYNEAAALAKSLGKTWLLLADQDTNFPDDIFYHYVQGVQSNPETSLFAPILVSSDKIIYSPCTYLFGRGFQSKAVVPGIQSFDNKSVLNSGLLISLDAFEQVGGYNVNLPLDFSDFNFIDKFKKNHGSFCLLETFCIHDLSPNSGDFNSSLGRFGRYCDGIKLHVTNPLDIAVLYLLTFLRAVKLCKKFSTLIFFSRLLKSAY
jgi:rhamnosyltransferase